MVAALTMEAVVIRTSRVKPLLPAIFSFPLILMLCSPFGSEVNGRWAWVAFLALVFIVLLAAAIWPSRLTVDRHGIEQVHFWWRLHLGWRRIDRVTLRGKQIVLVLRGGPWGKRTGVGAWLYAAGEQPLAVHWTVPPARLLELLQSWQKRAEPLAPTTE